MGRITLFTTEHCLHSIRLKHEFKKRNIPVQEISISQFPEKRQDLFQLTRRMTTPQAFFNTRYVGGCESTIKLLKEWDKDKNYKTATKKYEAQIGRFPDPTNPLLAIPTTKKMKHDDDDDDDDDGQEEEPQGRSSGSSISTSSSNSGNDNNNNNNNNNNQTTINEPITVELELPSGPKTYRVWELQEELEQVLPLSNLSYNLTSYKNSVTGTKATKALMDHFCCTSREEAEGIGKQLNDKGVLHHCCYDHGFMDTPKLFFRLQKHQTPNILNSFYILQDDDVIENDVDKANELVERMERLLQQLELECFNIEKGGIQYNVGTNRSAFHELEEGLCHFQTIAFESMHPKQLLAFGLNVYNLMIRFSFFKYGIPKKVAYQHHFLRDIYFKVGGNLYSFNEWLSQISAGKVSSEPSSPTGSRQIRTSFTLANPDAKKISTVKQKKKERSLSYPSPTKKPITRSKSDSKSKSKLKSEYRNNFTPTDLASSDYRVYFAANFFRCEGTAIVHFTAENIEKELNTMALAFVADDENVVVDTNRGELRLSNIFSWYRKDFNPNANLENGDDNPTSNSSNNKELTELVFQYMEAPKKLQLRQLMYSGSGKKLKVSFHSDDWTVNAVAKKCPGFTPSLIEANCPRSSFYLPGGSSGTTA